MTSPDGPTIRLRKALERAIAQGHPWIYRDAAEPFHAAPGAVATVVDARGRFVARGFVDAGPIAVRVLTTRDEAVGAALFEARVARAAALRDRVVPPETDAYRLVNGEGDRLPGVVCDVYGPWAVLRLDGEGALAWRDTVARALDATLRARGVTALLARRPRGATPAAEALWGAAPGDVIEVRERGMTLCADLLHGQKTGLFLDQRESRRRVRELASGLRVLNLYGYTGGFSVAAGLGGATRVETVDVARGALALADRTWARNGLDPARHASHAEDAPAFLAARARAGGRYDLVIADPPSFAPSEASVEAALQGYRALHAGALALVAPGGYYLAASCSSHVRREAFLDTIREGAGRARRVLQVLDAWGAPADHPRLAAFPEGDYLKVALTRLAD